MEQTLAIIKPDAVCARNSGKIIDIIESHGFSIVEMKKLKLTKAQAEKFYEIHKKRSFFQELVNFMTSGPVIMMILYKDNAISDWRTLMGATNPAEADLNTIRRLYGSNIGENATHGSDSLETALQEISLIKNWL